MEQAALIRKTQRGGETTSTGNVSTLRGSLDSIRAKAREKGMKVIYLKISDLRLSKISDMMKRSRTALIQSMKRPN